MDLTLFFSGMSKSHTIVVMALLGSSLLSSSIQANEPVVTPKAKKPYGTFSGTIQTKPGVPAYGVFGATDTTWKRNGILPFEDDIDPSQCYGGHASGKPDIHPNGLVMNDTEHFIRQLPGKPGKQVGTSGIYLCKP